MTYQHEIETMLAAARNAGELALRHFNAGTIPQEKADLSPVTAADRECERLIQLMLSAAFPDDGIMGEEGTFKPSLSGRRWLIDPIDGTRDFIRGNCFWSVQIALEAEASGVMGAIYFPCLHRMLYAVDGQGCYWDDSPVRHSGQTQLDKAILMVSGFKAAWEAWPPDAVRQLTEKCWAVRSYGASYDIAVLARGQGDVWLSGSGMEWDYAAARVIARECGAKFLIRDGTDRIDARHCLICPPGLERELRHILRIPAAG